MPVSFRVDDVPAASELLPTRPLGEALGEALAIGGDPRRQVIDHGPSHPLLAAVHIAFAEHRPLVLAPDAVWLTIAGGVAQHVRMHADVLRPRLVRHAGVRRLEIVRDGSPSTEPNWWAGVVDEFRDRLAEDIGQGPARLFECDFSTSGDAARVAGRIALMDVYSHYYEYYLMCACGIPEITVLGTPEDWRRIRERVDVLAEWDLGFWTRSLAPILDQLVRAAEERPDLEFWRGIYKPAEVYGGDVITGWIARLYPYLRGDGQVGARNPLLATPLDDPGTAGVRSDSVPDSPAVARVQVVLQDSGERVDVMLEGGVLAVEQDAAGRLVPVCGWALRRDRPAISAIVARIREEHAFVAVPPESPHRRSPFGLMGPADFIGLYSEIEQATLFAGAAEWRLRPPGEHEHIVFPMDDALYNISAERFLDLPDGSFIAVADLDYHHVLLRCRDDALEPPDTDEYKTTMRQRDSSERVEDVPYYRMTIAQLLARVLDSGGALDIPGDGRLKELVPPRSG